MTKKPTTHGGRRKGAGRKRGSVRGRKAVSKTIAMHPHSWDKLDAARGATPRGKFIEQKLFPSTKGKKYELVMDFSTNTLHGLPV
jgi:hypothetical protein